MTYYKFTAEYSIHADDYVDFYVKSDEKTEAYNKVKSWLNKNDYRADRASVVFQSESDVFDLSKEPRSLSPNPVITL